MMFDVCSLMRKHYVRISINTRLLQVDDDSDDNYNGYENTVLFFCLLL